MTRKSAKLHYVGLVILVVALIVGGFVFTRQLSIQSTPLISTNDSGAIGGFQRHPQPLSLMTVTSAEKALGHALQLPPNPSAISSGMKVIGVDLQRSPTTLTYDNGSRSFTYFVVVIYLWNAQFVNGTTTDQQVLGGGGMTIMESTFGNDASFNATVTAEALVNQGHFVTITQTTTSNGQVTQVESTITRDSKWWSYISYINGQPAVVSPGQHGVTWADTTAHMWITIVGTSFQTDALIQFASSMIH